VATGNCCIACKHN